MKKRLLTIGLSLLCIAIVICTVVILQINRLDELEALQQEALAELEAKAGDYDERQIVLYGTSNSEAKELAELFGAELRITNNGRFARLTLPEGTTIYDVYSNDEYRVYLEDMSIDYKASISDVEALEEDEEKTERLPLAPEFSVTDTDFSKQSYYNYVNMKNVWSSYTGSGVTVAVIDTGIDTDHPEFAGRISEYSYNATEDKIVKDYTDENGNYDWSLVEDEQGHGTAVTGVIAASMNSGNIVGISPAVNIITIKAECDEQGRFARTSDLVFGLYYAIERDVQVVNMSFGGGDVFSEAVQLAYDSDVICVAAAGNESTSSLTYPAAYEHVIGVGALADDSWELADYSNYGENVDIVAPGTTYTAEMGGGYSTINGTSLSAPIVTGAVALLMQNNKYITFDAVTEVLYESTYDIGDLGPDWYYGYGALDVNELICGERGTITFDMLTDELDNTEQLFIRGHALQNIPEPERTYAVFDGWYYDHTFTEELDYYADEFKGDLTLYAKWANEEDGVPYTYVTLDDGTIEIRSYTGKRRFITVPEKIDGKVVSSIGDFAFAGQTRLREVTLPSGLTRIGMSAFANCSNLVTIEIPENVTTIGEYAFSGNVRLNVIAFLGNSKLKTIGDFAFESCGRLEKIELPASLESINGSAFLGTTWLTSIDVQSGNKSFVDIDGVLFNVTKTTVVAYPSAHGTAYELPEGVTTIGQYAFAFAGIDTIELDGVMTIEGCAFGVSSLESVVIPDSVTSMGTEVFSGCSDLSDVTIGRGISGIPERSFFGCLSLEYVSIPNTIIKIDSKAFASSALKAVEFKNGSTLTVIGDSAFALTPLESIEIPSSVTIIGDSAFYGDAILNIVTFCDESALSSIGNSAFEKCYGLTSINLPSKLQTIGEMAFYESGLADTVTVPASVTAIGRGAFASCRTLTAIDVADGNTVYHDIDGVVYSLDNKELHAYPTGKSDTEYTVNGATVSLMPYSFTGCVNLVTTYLPEGLEQIAERAFYQCSSLSYMTIPDNVTQIGRYSFAECWNLATITINNTSKLPRLSYAAFAYSGITSFTVPTNVSTMAQGVFQGCQNLTSVTFAENSKLESISAYMFDGCNNLTSITFMPGSSLTSVQAHGLEGMGKLTTLDFTGTKLTNVDNFAFRFCEKLSSVALPETVTNIGRYAFYGCKSMTELSVPAAVEHIGMFAFLGTGDMDLYFNADILPTYADENWDYDLKGYYLGVTDVITDGDIKYAKTTGGNVAILEYTGTATTLDLTTYDFGSPITIIGGSAFEESEIESIILPETLGTIQAEAFAYSKLKNIEIPAGVTFIGREAFVATPISSLTFAENSNITTIEQYAFELTRNLTNVTLPKSLTTMGTGVFSQSGITSVTFEKGIAITEIPQNAFAETKLTSVIIPDSVSLVNHNAFNNVQTLKNVTFGTAPELRLMSNAFYHTGLTSLNVPANVTYIGEYCFVALPDLTSITVDEANPNYKSVDGLLLTKNGRKLISVPAGRTGTLNVPVSIEEIGFGAFEESRLSAVNFDKNANILTFGYRAFFKAESITEITVPASVVSIDFYAFAYCKNLTTVNFADGIELKGIYEGAFCGDINLENITIPDSIVEISDFAFYGCTKINDIPVSETTGLKGIYDYAFAYTNIGGEYTFPGQLVDIGDYAFAGCDFTKITVPDDNKKQLFIGLGAFEDNNKLVEITLPFIGRSYEDEEISWFGYIFGAGSYKANDTYVPDSLKKFTITEGITFVGIGGFYGITTVEEASIPHSVQVLYGMYSIELGYHDGAFSESTFLYELTNEIETVSIMIVNGTSKEIYSVLSNYFGIGIKAINISDSITAIVGAFEECINLTSIELPESVKTIGDHAFDGCSNLTSIVLPENVKHIGFYAFENCTSLTSIILPEGVTNIDSYAFFNCISLTNIVLPKSLKYINLGTFRSCSSLTSINLPENVIRIHSYAFSGCSSLTSITLPESVTRIDDGAFSSCNSLYQIQNYSGLNLTIGSSDNGEIAYDAQVIIDKDGNRVYRDGLSGFIYLDTPDNFRFVYENNVYKLIAYIGKEDTVTLPQGINGTSYDIYKLRGVKNVIVPEGISRIDSYAFYGCSSLTSIVLPEGITSIGNSAFGFCSNLTSIVLPEGVTSIGYRVFEYCSNLTSVVLPKSVTSIGSNAFSCCKSLTNISIPKFVTQISDFTFNGCINLKSIELPESITNIGRGAFEDCSNLTSITLPESVTSIGSGAFEYCNSLTSIIIPPKVAEIKANTFSDSTLVYVHADNKYLNIIDGIIYNKTTSIVIGTLGRISENVVLPKSVTRIGDYAFKDCSGLVNITLPESVTSIGSNAFENCSNLTSIVLPKKVTSIGDWAFYCCSSLTSITLPEGVTSIYEYAFFGCSSLASITLPESVTSICESAFSSCRSLTNITIPEGVTSIGRYAFSGSGLTSITLPESVTSICESAFSSCRSLTNIVFPESLTSIGNSVFSYCRSLTNIVLPKSATSIGNFAFSNCNSLTSITIPEGVTSIGRYAFSNCNSLSSVTLPKDNMIIGDGAFEDCSHLYQIENNSDLNLTFGSSTNGKITYYAKVVIDKNGKKMYRDGSNGFEFIDTNDGFRFIYENNVYKLIAYIGKEDTVTLPQDINGMSYDIYKLGGVKNVIVPEGISRIGSYAFYGCSSLTSIVLPESITSIGSNAFENCSNLTSIVLPKKVTSIGDWAFYCCSSLASITLPENLISIGSGVFDGCSKLYDNRDYFQEGIMLIDSCLIGVNENMKYLTCIEKIKNVYNNAYENCHSLKTAVWGNGSIPSNVETLYLTNITVATPYLQNTSTLKNVIICDTVDASDLRYCQQLFTHYNVTGVTIYVESLESDLRWDDNFPGWHNGNRVAYGDKWNMVNFYDNEGKLTYSEPRLNSQIIRHPAVISDDPCLDVIGWDINGDGAVDIVPATTTVDITAVPVTKVRHDIVYHEAKVPTCTETGWEAYVTCTRCDYTTYVEKTKFGHDEVEHDAKAPTCTEIGWNAYETCGKCDYSTYVELPATGHSYTKTVTAPTCTEQGYTTYTCHCSDTYVSDYVKETGHTEVTDAAVPATCTKTGLTEGKHCSACDKILTEQQTTDALGHDFSPEWTVDIEPTTTTTGLKTRHCSRCDETTDPIEIAKLVDASKLFRDLKVKKWSIDGINYVVSYSYMNGTGDGTTFDQTGSMTRAMIVSVLYRMAGQPETSVDNPFTDVSAKSKWYYNAVLWAYENGIVTGTSKTTFSPNGDVTREQIATFLYRYAKYKGYDTTATTDISVYPDSAKVGKWAREALVWANAEELITGAKSGDTVLLDPQGKATREQVATILMRFCQAFAE